MQHRTAIILLAILLVAVTGCAGTGSVAPSLTPGGGYVLNAEEKALDCRRLTGRVQVRLLALRGEEYKVAPSAVAGAMRTATSTALMTDTAKNAAARAAVDRPLLVAYNDRLKELGCKSFDIDKELEARPSAPTPVPTIPAIKKAP